MSIQAERLDGLLGKLNEKQRYGATRQDGKYLVLAGSGSGKTTLITYRVAYLIEMGVKPWEIVSISFTNKAASELTERIVKLVGEKGQDVNTGTFHSLCTRILLKNQGALNMENLTVISENDSESMIKEIAESYGYLKEATNDIFSFIKYCGNEGLYPEDLLDEETREKYPADFLAIHEEYTNQKRRIGYVDFDDLLGLTHKLFKLRPDILETYSKKYKYIILDESQDNSGLQSRMLLQLSSYWGNYMLVGDDLQSIYGFRGADVDTFIKIRDVETDIETILLERNYRSTGNIIKASNIMVENNNNQMEKVSYTEREDGAPVFVYESDDDLRESEYVVNMIEGLVSKMNYSYDDIAILYRSNYLSMNFSLAFSSAGIPYDIQQGTNFYDREEIKTIVGYLRVLENPLDDIALEYIINRPKRGIGPTTINRLKMYASGVNLPLSMVLEHVDDIPKINKPTKERIKVFDEVLKKAKEISKTTTSVTKLIQHVVMESHLMEQYDVSKSKDLTSIENIQELFNIAMAFDEKEVEVNEENQTILTQFLTETALYATEEERALGKVTLSSVHSSKGLEFKIVFLVGLQQGTFPSYKSLSSLESLEEERRLMYVGMTRAEDMLFLSYNRVVYRYGKSERSEKSMFINELPKEHIQYIGTN